MLSAMLVWSFPLNQLETCHHFYLATTGGAGLLPFRQQNGRIVVRVSEMLIIYSLFDPRSRIPSKPGPCFTVSNVSMMRIKV